MTECHPDFPPPRREEKPATKTVEVTKNFNCPLYRLNEELGRRAERKKYDQEREAREEAERNRPGGHFLD